MTNHIEAMMKTGGVDPLDRCKICKAQEFALGQCAEVDCEVIYPDFTAEKQLEIIKLIGLERGFKIIPNEGYDYMLSEDTYAKYELNRQGYSMTDFTQALANLTTELMNINALDKSKVKEILEDAR